MNNIATIGFFDGVHLGHRHLIRQVVAESQRNNGMPCVVTFTKHPRSVITGDAMKLLTTYDEKHELLREAGIRQIFDIDFTTELMQMSAHDFMQAVLKKHFGIDTLIIGYDHRFGHGRTDGFSDYVRYGGELGINVIRADAYENEGHPVSSSRIRTLLSEQGDVSAANRLLGYHYTLCGKVVKGYGRGRLMGFPTANIETEACKLVPRDGVYAVKAHTPFGTYDGMLNIGQNPTYNNTERTIEAHLFDFGQTLYGHKIKVELTHHIRNEKQFASTAELTRQILADETEIRAKVDKRMEEKERKEDR